ncbi:hypothetical protein EDD18DRAFT_340295 [Armillaria luteobubalina]|uniref:Uncharacterized protein n=1 Tax=Armillaria luteobubalina TaxID=153913 RepID=A0AA39QMD4_9AGAR|nr:hypothetical protein EDD18DRAFT_340295 [Armillaria luteobubalina]
MNARVLSMTPFNPNLDGPVEPPARAALIHPALHRSRYSPRAVSPRNAPSIPSPSTSSGESSPSAITSLSLIVGRYATSFPSVLGLMINIKHIRSLVTLELDRCDAEPQDFSDMVTISIRDLRLSGCHSNVCFLLGPVAVVNLEVHGPGLDGECMPIGLTLRCLTYAHLGQLKSLCLVDTCRDAGCSDLLHLARALERPFSSLEALVVDIPLSEVIHRKLIQLLTCPSCAHKLSDCLGDHQGLA